MLNIKLYLNVMLSRSVFYLKFVLVSNIEVSTNFLQTDIIYVQTNSFFAHRSPLRRSTSS